MEVHFLDFKGRRVKNEECGEVPQNAHIKEVVADLESFGDVEVEVEKERELGDGRSSCYIKH